jgi:hypothetical protein
MTLVRPPTFTPQAPPRTLAKVPRAIEEPACEPTPCVNESIPLPPYPGGAPVPLAVIDSAVLEKLKQRR